MQTRCPQCNTIFRVTEDHLQQAGGKVRCGQCQSVFDGRAHLIDALDEPPAAEATETAQSETRSVEVDETDMEFIDLSGRRAASEGQPAARRGDREGAAHTPAGEEADEFDALDGRGPVSIPGQLDIPLDQALPDEDSLLEEDRRATDGPEGAAAEDVERLASMAAEVDKQRVDEEQDIFIMAPSQDEAGEAGLVTQAPGAAQAEAGAETLEASRPRAQAAGEHAAGEHAAAEHAAGEHAAAEHAAAEHAAEEHAGEETLPFALRRDLLKAERPPRHWSVGVMYAAGAVILLAALIAQLAVFRNAELVHAWPQLRPLMGAFCERLPCYYTGPRAVGQVSLVNRDVRSHPSAPNALLISATIINNADFRQPYPDIRITLSDLSGTVVAKRRFTPAEYLDRLYHRFVLMEPRTPVHIDLAVLDPGADAVNFEFEFL